MDNHSLNINIIYVKGSVEFLLPFLRTLLKNSECRYRLVSNGCSSHEESMLIKYCDEDARCDFYSINTKVMQAHHDVLNELLKVETSPYFVFMDSDILASAPFINSWLSYLSNHEAIFSALPFWQNLSDGQMPANFQIVDGRFFNTSSGHFLGVTYFAAYRREKLIDFMDRSGITFSNYGFKDIPKRYQNFLVEMDLNRSFYDTGKLLNILWQREGAKMTYIELDSLHHIGGLSIMLQKDLSLVRRGYNFVRHLIPIYIRVFIGKIRKGGRIQFRELLNMEILVRKKRAIKSLVFQQLYGTKVGFINGFLLRKVTGEMKKKTVYITDLIKKSE